VEELVCDHYVNDLAMFLNLSSFEELCEGVAIEDVSEKNLREVFENKYEEFSVLSEEIVEIALHFLRNRKETDVPNDLAEEIPPATIKNNFHRNTALPAGGGSGEVQVDSHVADHVEILPDNLCPSAALITSDLVCSSGQNAPDIGHDSGQKLNVNANGRQVSQAISKESMSTPGASSSLQREDVASTEPASAVSRAVMLTPGSSCAENSDSCHAEENGDDNSAAHQSANTGRDDEEEGRLNDEDSSGDASSGLRPETQTSRKVVEVSLTGSADGEGEETSYTCPRDQNQNASHSASSCQQKQSLEEMVRKDGTALVDSAADLGKLFLAKVTEISGGLFCADPVGTGRMKDYFPMEENMELAVDDTIFVDLESASKKTFLVLKHWDSYPGCFTGFVSKILSSTMVEVSFVSENSLVKTPVPIDRIKYLENSSGIQEQAVSVGSETLIFVQPGGPPSVSDSLPVVVAIQGFRKNVIYEGVSFSDVAGSFLERCQDHLADTFPDVQVDVVQNRYCGSNGMTMMFKGTSGATLSDVVELAKVAASNYARFQSTNEHARGSISHEASLLFDIAGEPEKKLKKELEFYSILSGVQLELNENCIKAKCVDKKSIEEILKIICLNFQIQFTPFYNNSSEETAKNMTAPKEIKQEVENDLLGSVGEKVITEKKNELSSASLNSDYVQNLLSAIQMAQPVSEARAAKENQLSGKSWKGKQAKKNYAPIRYPEPEKDFATVSLIVENLCGILDSPSGNVIFHKHSIFDAKGRKISLRKLRIGTKVSFHAYPVSKKIKEEAAKLMPMSNLFSDIKWCAGCVYLGSGTPAEKSQSSVIKDMEDELRQWNEFGSVTANEQAGIDRKKQPLGERRVIEGPSTSVSITSFNSSVTACKELDPVLARKLGPCPKHFNFKKCYGKEECKYAHEIPLHMDLEFSPQGFLDCRKNCSLAQGELHRNYTVLSTKYKGEIRRLKQNCDKCYPSDVPERICDSLPACFTVLDEYIAEDSSDEENIGSDQRLLGCGDPAEVEITVGPENSYDNAEESKRGFQSRESSERVVCITDFELETDALEDGELETRETFQLEVDSPPHTRKRVCSFFERGACKYGRGCRDLHVPADLRYRLGRNTSDINRNLPDLRQSMQKRSNGRRRL
jgi:hypothetical protein